MQLEARLPHIFILFFGFGHETQEPQLTLEQCDDRREIGGGNNEGACNEEGDGDVTFCRRSEIASGGTGASGTVACSSKEAGSEWRVVGW